MAVRLPQFWTDQSGAVALDWIVLTAVLLGTGYAVATSVQEGVRFAGFDAATKLRGHVVRASFGAEICTGGIEGAQQQEDLRLARGGTAPVDIALWMDTRLAGLGDGPLLLDRDRLARALPQGLGWTRDHSILSAIDCEIVLRGLD
ncbi:hypothetical protein [Jannaschia sp. M317]|uniref:hypothetical protein n=1 Tax=Jannaschia sp. M317 TaxID=2867011 RepID=UPI0021A3D1EC|nr:hypothetical protein [Jannaschia sp. M317]UWQ18617.1 hypothetical protein K3551_04815 [Jannaschia sp. M317]